MARHGSGLCSAGVHNLWNACVRGLSEMTGQYGRGDIVALVMDSMFLRGCPYPHSLPGMDHVYSKRFWILLWQLECLSPVCNKSNSYVNCYEDKLKLTPMQLKDPMSRRLCNKRHWEETQYHECVVSALTLSFKAAFTVCKTAKENCTAFIFWRNLISVVTKVHRPGT